MTYQRRCVCDRFTPGEPQKPGDCPYCWMWNDQGQAGQKFRQGLTGKPSLIRRTANFVKATVRHALDMTREVSDETYAARLAVCDGCELKAADWTCNHPDCGCFLKTKAKWASEDCPLGKWEKEAEPPPVKAAAPTRTGCCGS